MKENEYKIKIDMAIKMLMEHNNTYEAVSLLSTIINVIPDNDIKALTVVGSLFRKVNELPKALICFEKAMKIASISPRVSLGYFHTLWGLERFDEAFDELERFFSLSKNEEHGQLLKDDGEHLKLLEKMREEFFEDNSYRFEDPVSLIKKMRKSFFDS